MIVSNDLANLQLARRFDYIWAFSVLIHLEDEILLSTLTFVDRHLASSGQFLANVNLGQRQDDEWHHGFPVVWRSLEFYERLASRAGMTAHDLGIIVSLGFESGQIVHDQIHIIKFILQ